MNTKQLFSFEDLAKSDKALRSVIKIFSQAGVLVLNSSSSIDPKIKRSNGISYREMFIAFGDGQIVTLRIKQTGDIFQVLLNLKVVPISNQDDHKKTVTEIVRLLDSNRSKFQAALAKATVPLPKGIKTAAPTMIVALTKQRDGLKEAIAMVNSEIETLNPAAPQPVTA